MAQNFIKRTKVFSIKKENLYPLYNINRNKIRIVIKETKLILITLQQYHKVLKFNIIKIVIYNIILGLP